MAKFSIEKIYEQLDKTEDAAELYDAFEKLKTFVANKISGQATELEDKSSELNEIVKKINGN